MKASEGRFHSFFFCKNKGRLKSLQSKSDKVGIMSKCQGQREAGGRGFFTVESLCAPTPRLILDLELNSPF